jgi:transcriptional regulator with XRE-family HTH domain
MGKATYKDYVLGTAKAHGMSAADLAKLTGVSSATLYRRLESPDTMDRAMIKLLHRHIGLTYEEIIERR